MISILASCVISLATVAFLAKRPWKTQNLPVRPDDFWAWHSQWVTVDDGKELRKCQAWRLERGDRYQLIIRDESRGLSRFYRVSAS